MLSDSGHSLKGGEQYFGGTALHSSPDSPDTVNDCADKQYKLMHFFVLAYTACPLYPYIYRVYPFYDKHSSTLSVPWNKVMFPVRANFIWTYFRLSL